MEAIKILVVDDEEDILEILKFNLENEGYLVETAASGEAALRKLSPEHQLILLDVMLGDTSGYRVAEKVRKANNPIPIIFLTAKGSENDLLTGFSVGGDDYIAKPFSIKEVIVRIRAVLRRNLAPVFRPEPTELLFGPVRLDLVSKRLCLRDRSVILTKKEFEILRLLMQDPKRVFSRDAILQTAWENDCYVLERTVDVHVARLRKKMGEFGVCITNRSGYGYSFNDSFCTDQDESKL
jgi:two-component system alkaline phosphatase synthesis response regulator PhoP